MKLLGRLLGTSLLLLMARNVIGVEVVIYDPAHPDGITCTGYKEMTIDSSSVKIWFDDTCITATDANDGGDSGNDNNSGDDGSGDGGDTGTQDPEDPGNDGTGLVCVNSDGVVCMPRLPILETVGSKNWIDIPAGTIQVYKFTFYSLRSNGEAKISYSPSDTTAAIEFTINQNAGSMEGEPNCAHESPTLSISSTAGDERYGYCVLVPGETYFLNVKNIGETAGAYTLVRN